MDVSDIVQANNLTLRNKTLNETTDIINDLCTTKSNNEQITVRNKLLILL